MVFVLIALSTAVIALQRRAHLGPVTMLESNRRRAEEPWEEYYEKNIGLEDKIKNTMWYIQDVHCERQLLRKEVLAYKETRDALGDSEEDLAKIEKINNKIKNRQKEMKSLNKLKEKKITKFEEKLGQDARTIDLSNKLCKQLYVWWDQLNSKRRRMSVLRRL